MFGQLNYECLCVFSIHSTVNIYYFSKEEEILKEKKISKFNDTEFLRMNSFFNIHAENPITKKLSSYASPAEKLYSLTVFKMPLEKSSQSIPT